MRVAIKSGWFRSALVLEGDTFSIPVYDRTTSHQLERSWKWRDGSEWSVIGSDDLSPFVVTRDTAVIAEGAPTDLSFAPEIHWHFVDGAYPATVVFRTHWNKFRRTDRIYEPQGKVILTARHACCVCDVVIGNSWNDIYPALIAFCLIARPAPPITSA